MSREVISTIIFYGSRKKKKNHSFNKWFHGILYKQHWYNEKVLYNIFRLYILDSDIFNKYDLYANKGFKFIYSNIIIRRTQTRYYNSLKNSQQIVCVNQISNKNIVICKPKYRFISIPINASMIFGFEYNSIYYIFKKNMTFSHFYLQENKSHFENILQHILAAYPFYNDHNNKNIKQILKTKSISEFFRHKYTKKNYYITF